MPVALGLAIYWGKNFTYEQLFLKVSTDLAVSHDAFHRIQGDYLNHLTSLAESHQFRSALESGNNASVLEQVNNLKNNEKFSFLKVISTENDKKSNVLTSRRNSSALLNALKGKETVGVEIYSAEELLLEDPELHDRVQLPILPTPRAKPSNRTKEDRAMVIRALYPVKDSSRSSGRTIGWRCFTQWSGHDSLEDKVESRTTELKHKNQDLENSIKLLRQTRQQLVVAEKLAALGELTAGVAHEINNPTAVMLGNLDIMVDELGKNAIPVQKEIDLVIDQIYRIKDIINRLLQYAHPDEYSGYINMVEVNTLIKDTLKLVNHLSQGKSIEFKMDLRATQVVEINPQELQQVLVNLLVNAIHALEKDDTEITLKSRNWKDKGVVISVSDNGKGIEKEHLEQIFNPFFSTKEQGEGTGLGLSISYGLVRRYGGNITAESNVGEGSTFSVWLLSEPQIMEDEEAIAEQLSIIEEAAM
ncbi:Sensor protein ZraS [Nymphon striatum]|nr:Sensor protein ZraS [Nymphon striatum]